jgi:hypothetical protein
MSSKCLLVTLEGAKACPLAGKCWRATPSDKKRQWYSDFRPYEVKRGETEEIISYDCDGFTEYKP